MLHKFLLFKEMSYARNVINQLYDVSDSEIGHQKSKWHRAASAYSTSLISFADYANAIKF